MRTALVTGIALITFVTGLGAGGILGWWIGRHSAVMREVNVLALTSEQARMAFEHAAPQAAWDLVMRHRDHILEKGELLGATGQQFELMVAHARLVVLARELGQPDADLLAAALEACRRAAVRECSPARILDLTGPRALTFETAP